MGVGLIVKDEGLIEIEIFMLFVGGGGVGEGVGG